MRYSAGERISANVSMHFRDTDFSLIVIRTARDPFGMFVEVRGS